jgi:hypothetical protein
MAEPVPRHLSLLSEASHRWKYSRRNDTYHTSASWLWLAWHIVALSERAISMQPKNWCHAFCSGVTDRQVNEVPTPNGKPLSSRWYTSAYLTWNAGMVIYACRIFESKKQENHKLLSLLHKPTE